MSDPTRRDLATIGRRLGEREGQDGRLLKTALRAAATTDRGPVGSDGWLEHVAAQVYAAGFREEPAAALEYAETFVDVYGIEDLGDVDDLLSRERHELRNYAGQLAFAGAE